MYYLMLRSKESGFIPVLIINKDTAYPGSNFDELFLSLFIGIRQSTVISIIADDIFSEQLRKRLPYQQV